MSDSITNIYLQMADGDDSAVRKLWERFFPRLLGFAKHIYHRRPDRVVEAEDAVASAFIDFCFAARNGGVENDIHRLQLWRLLKVFTRRKIARQLEFDTALKRGSGKVVLDVDLSTSREHEIDELSMTLPIHEFDLNCEEMVQQLPEPELQEIVIAKLLGYSNGEIAEMRTCSVRRIERKLNLIRKFWLEVVES